MSPVPSQPDPHETGRPTWCEVDLNQLVSNYQRICEHVGDSVAVTPVIKANAYGHGLGPCGLALQQAGTNALAVAYVEEGIALREVGVTTEIHVLGGAVTRQIPLFLEHELTFTAPSVDKLRQIDEAAGASGTTARVHLKIDTGMERIGVHHYNADTLFETSLTCHNVEIAGVFSHFANADEPAANPGDSANPAKPANPAGPATAHLPKTEAQLDHFLQALSFFERRSLPTPTRHIASSGAIARLPAAHLDLVRPGIALFGCGDWSSQLGTHPVLSWQSEVIFFKVVPPSTPVGYGGTWQSPNQTRIITLPVGYADGYKRSMSTQAQVLVNGQRCDTVGTICMDQTMVDIGPDASAYNGDRVVLIGGSPGLASSQPITVADLANWSGASSYEVLTSISARVPRRYLPAAGR